MKEKHFEKVSAVNDKEFIQPTVITVKEGQEREICNRFKTTKQILG